LVKYRWSYDDLTTKAIERLAERKQEGESVQELDVFEQLQREAGTGEDKLITEFWSEAHGVPDWVDWNAIDRGQDVSFACLSSWTSANCPERQCTGTWARLGLLSTFAVY
jgi:hypothetical protein